MNESAIFTGTIEHRRLFERRHASRHRISMMYLDLEEVDQMANGMLVRPGPGILRFRRSDYLGDAEIPLIDAVRSVVASHAMIDVRGPIRLLAQVRTLGHCFNPVAFYYCFSEADQLQAIVAEVTNTPWGERHVYVFTDVKRSDPDALRGTVTKAFHVSPFMDMDLQYEWSATVPDHQLLVEFRCTRQGASVLDVRLAMRRRAMTRRSLRLMLLRHPLPTIRVLVLIYLHAVALKLKGNTVRPHP